jgi:16S rRNA (adenine1518-N6/adenine1519-N6)-dimethyltransferase
MVRSAGIPLKKQFGQHFLRNQQVVEHMVQAVDIKDASVFEIGCGDGFLTQHILSTDIARLWVFEIDREWVNFVTHKFSDKRLHVFHENFLDLNWRRLQEFRPWTVLANLPYQVTFPILHRIQEHREMIKEGVVMVQEEVAQKIFKTSGRGYGYPSLFFQYYFDWKLLDKVAPTDFYPPPKVYSRLIYFKPKKDTPPIPDEEGFWKFIKVCFKQPRRTLRNNLKQGQYDSTDLTEILDLRAQQMSMADLLDVWNKIRS